MVTVTVVVSGDLVTTVVVVVVVCRRYMCNYFLHLPARVCGGPTHTTFAPVPHNQWTMFVLFCLLVGGGNNNNR